MAGFRERDKHYFPLKCAEDVVDLFKEQLENTAEPDLTLLSIVLGAVEACLTVNRTINKAENGDRNCAEVGSWLGTGGSFPAISEHTIEALYQRLSVHVKGSVDLTQYQGAYTTRELVKKVSDVIWNSLARSYHKDKAHLQSIYSLLTGNKLDCFGVALATVAACQQLGCDDVHLALSEDHAWIVFGEDGTETVEVTWHGKGLEDKRGLPITQGLGEKSWLYLNGHPVRCNRYTEVAAIVSAINPAINSTMDSVELAGLQQKLLWYLYDKGHLDKYPQALGNLGELEDNNPTGREISALDLFTQATRAAQEYYGNAHVYPYTYLGSYYYRKGSYRLAIENWSKAGRVISQYNHNREDEEIYKEFLEIANEHIPNIMKVAAEELHRAHLIPPIQWTPLLQDPSVYSLLLQLYDGICQWEEGSSTPVLHAVWAQHLVHTLSKFEEEARVSIQMERGEEEEEEDEEEETSEPKWKLRHENNATERCRRDSGSKRERQNSMDKDQNLPVKRGRGRPPKRVSLVKDNNNSVKESSVLEFSEVPAMVTNGTMESCDQALEGAGDSLLPNCNEEQIKSTIEELVSRVGGEVPSSTPNPKLAALAQACGESILNPEFLITGGEPFAMSPSDTEALLKDDGTLPEPENVPDQTSSNKSNEALLDSDCGSALTKDREVDLSDEAQIVPQQPSSSSSPESGHDSKAPIMDQGTPENDQVFLSLHSAKMRGLKGILTARKLNSNAIKLQLTAQSQVYLKHSVSGNATVGVPRKRLRRE